ncbi:MULTISPECIES: electron transfer flavoprotein subunit alpha/FixB family protein [unclassified Corynebacterium]|uniref:electron transfer flavoprotein subunit alpha/FixB family protein n=1 Tax=unclassified Corynebacterium TaxID=2624378 RepID=UPI003523CFB4
MSHAYVLVEHTSGELDEVTVELITAARVFGAVSAVVVGNPGTAAPLAGALTAAGADQIVAAEAEGVSTRLVLPAVDALSILASSNPAPVLVASSPAGDEVAARLAVRLGAGVLCDVVGVNADRTAHQSIFGDTVSVTSAVGGESPVYAVRAGAIEAEPRPGGGELVALELPGATEKDVRVTGFTPAERGDRPTLAQAKVVVAGGRGVGSAEGFSDIVEPLADALGGAVGATRDAIDHDWYGGQYQIGQTGVSVAPDLYIGLGVSGALQHKAGMQTSKTIIVVNNDEDAPLFEIADLGVVGDLFSVVPALTEEIARRKQV